MTGKLKKLYFYFLITAVSGFAVGYAVKYYFHSFNIPGQYMVLFAPLIFIFSAIFAVALPIYYRTVFAHSRRHLSEITWPELLKFERNLICMAMVAPYLALIGYLLELPRFYLTGTILLALYAVYYHYPSNNRMAFEKRIFRVGGP